MVVRRAEVSLAYIGQELAREHPAVVPSVNLDRHRPHRNLAQRFGESEPMQYTGTVGTYLDARPDLAQFGRLFEHLSIDARPPERQRRRESSDPGSDYDYSHASVRLRCSPQRSPDGQLGQEHLGLILDNFVNLGKILLELRLRQRRLQCVRIGQFPEIDYRIYTPDDAGVAPHQLHAALGQDGRKVVEQRNEILELPGPESDRCL